MADRDHPNHRQTPSNRNNSSRKQPTITPGADAAMSTDRFVNASYVVAHPAPQSDSVNPNSEASAQQLASTQPLPQHVHCQGAQQMLPFHLPFPGQTPMMLLPAQSFPASAGPSANSGANKIVPPSTGKQRKKMSSRELSHEENLLIISYWKENYDSFMKSNKKQFSRRAVEKLNGDAHFMDSNKPPLTAAWLENLFAYLMKRYKEVSDRFKQSGFGLTEEDPDSLKAVATAKCKYFWGLHEFLACRANVNPPVLLQPRGRKEGTVIDISKFGVMGAAAEKDLEDSDEEEDVMVDMVEPEEVDESFTRTKKNRASDPRRSSRGSLRSPQERASQGDNPRAKKRRLSGATLIRDSQPNKEGEPSRSKSIGLSEKEGKNSTGRVKLVNEMLASQITSTEEQNESYTRTVVAIEKESDIRTREISVLEKESEILEREQARKDREEERTKKEELRKDREDQRKEREAQRNAIIAKRKMVMEEAEQLRKQADMYVKMELMDEAVAAMRKSETLVKKLAELVDDDQEFANK